MEGRAAALSAREDKIAAAAQAAAEAEAAADWAPKRDHRLGPRPSPRVGRLFDMCLDLLVEHIEDVETLYGLPSAIKVCSWRELPLVVCFLHCCVYLNADVEVLQLTCMALSLRQSYYPPSMLHRQCLPAGKPQLCVPLVGAAGIWGVQGEVLDAHCAAAVHRGHPRRGGATRVLRPGCTLPL